MNYTKPKTILDSSTLEQVFKNLVFNDFCELTTTNSDELTSILFTKFNTYHPLFSQENVYATAEAYWASVVIPHKIAVYQAGIKLLEKILNVDSTFVKKEDFIKRLIEHDLSKFSALETYGYMMYSFNDKNSTIQKNNFKTAWHHHKQHNSHHPEYWIDVNKKGNTEILPMNKIDVLEMVADWQGAGNSYSTSFEDWATNNLQNFAFHQKTKDSLNFIFQVVDFDYNFV
jgi:hypothetical protein